ncbi:hypothetical protein PGT21_022935 [Puccinia graminis f. sp. tritici]|uniref:Uncharacterized protein n=1 Tax=Puccinia graminis f. sp. tritici TaxID=56615 RepID=A0A5B0N713_PUCGR|nr:hypothetical protein PGT21_022935 [Puccinia graminis f. sp. tritici]KAA1092342.1 hypothetical protein PGTUg99_021506 [Puccinia graminis f. sp. tritici]
MEIPFNTTAFMAFVTFDLAPKHLGATPLPRSQFDPSGLFLRYPGPNEIIIGNH